MSLAYQTMTDLRRRRSVARWLTHTALVGSLTPLLFWAGTAVLFFWGGPVRPDFVALIEGSLTGVFSLVDVAYIMFTLREGRSLVLGRRPLIAGTYLMVAGGTLVNFIGYGLLGLDLLFFAKLGMPPLTRGEMVCFVFAQVVLLSAVAQLVCAVVSLVKYHRVTGVPAVVPALA